MKLSFGKANLVILILSISAVALFILGFVIVQNRNTVPRPPSTPSMKKCATYHHLGKEVTACASCGDGICEPYETCTPSLITEDGLATRDCGPLNCEQDCL